MRTPWIGTLVLAVVLFPARGAAAQVGAVASAAEQVPGDVDLFLVVDRAAEWRRGPLGPPVWVMLRSLVGSGDAGRAWGKLAAQLEIGEEAVFDAVLGRRAVFVQRSVARPGAGGAPGSSWALVCSVSRETERLITRRLKPAPRRIENGLAVMAVEDGRFWLSIAPGGQGSTLLLGPTVAPELFDQISPTLGRATEHNLARSEAFRDLRALAGRPAAQALAMVRIGGDDPGWAWCSARPSGRELDVGLVVRTKGLGAASEGIEAWSREVFDEIAPGSYLSVVEWGLGGDRGWSVLRALTPEFALALPPAEVAGLLGPRSALVVGPSEDGPVSIVLGLETSDSPGLAGHADRLIARLVSGLWPGREAEGAMFDFSGQFPEAMREVDLSGPIGGLVPSLFPRGPMLAWRYGLGGAMVGGDAGGWWTIGLDRREVGRVGEALGTRRARVERKAPWLSLGVARPSAFLSELDRRKITLPAPLAGPATALRGVESFGWSIHRGEDGALVGQAKMRVMEAEPPPLEAPGR